MSYQAETSMRPKLRTRLENNQRAREELLSDINKALEFMDKNPDFEIFYDLVEKIGI